MHCNRLLGPDFTVRHYAYAVLQRPHKMDLCSTKSFLWALMNFRIFSIQDAMRISAQFSRWFNEKKLQLRHNIFYCPLVDRESDARSCYFPLNHSSCGMTHSHLQHLLLKFAVRNEQMAAVWRSHWKKWRMGINHNYQMKYSIVPKFISTLNYYAYRWDAPHQHQLQSRPAFIFMHSQRAIYPLHVCETVSV